VNEPEAVPGQPVLREVPPAIVNVSAVWVVAQLPRAKRILALEPGLARSAAFERRLGATGLSLFGPHEGGEAAIEVRSFAPSCGVDEDSVCGTGNGSIAVFRRERGLLPASGTSYVAAQGRCVGPDGRLSVTLDGAEQVSLGGACVTCVDGRLSC
jgi:PhzF family phenazine biosynthesis protein